MSEKPKADSATNAADRQEITDLIYRYAELIDAGDFDAVGQLLGRAQFGGPRTPTVTGADNIAAVFAMTTKRFPETGTPRTRHLVLNLIVEIDGDTAAARSTFCVVQATPAVPLQPIVAGRYYDRFARDGHGWHFTERIADVEMTGDVSDHLLIDPGSFDRGGESPG
ncbi:MAG: nuclear transport factor 2 family protein [Mycobacterium sp.]|nr:nuclear transport factor 2 family protein [Mycobacterium sp.]